MRVVRLLAALAVLLSSTAKADQFTSGNWVGSSYDDQSGNFSHCSMVASYNNGTLFLFYLTNDYKWSMGFANTTWNLAVGTTIPLRYYIDRGQVHDAVAQVMAKDHVVIELEDSAALFERMRKGWMIYLQAGGSDYQFSLQGTSRALARLAQCVSIEVAQRGGQGTSQSAQPTSVDPSLVMPTDATRLEATTFVANLLSQQGISGYRIMPANEIPSELKTFDTIWTGNGILGAVKVIPAMQGVDVSDIAAAVTSYDSKGCKGAFASGTRTLDEANLVSAQAVFTSCRSAASNTLVYYTIFPRTGGGYINFALVTINDDQRFEGEQKKFRAALVSMLKE